MSVWLVVLVGLFSFILGWYIERIVRALQRISRYAERFSR